MWTEKQIWELLEQVKDPEIPVLSLVDLGVITGVEVSRDHVRVQMTPTFSGCPAMEYMRREVEEVLKGAGIPSREVVMSFAQPWNSNKISAKGREALQKFGLAPPPQYQVFSNLEILEHVSCPNCHSEDTTLRSFFGPTLCRSLHYCNSCRQMFEQFKPV
ncbi:MAG: 1,2-phenylacetyl-CoA epoxidase subunit PaaD [Adhaeribacter sp.]